MKTLKIKIYVTNKFYLTNCQVYIIIVNEFTNNFWNNW